MKKMIKINKYFYVHFTTVFLLIICYINRNLDILAVNYTAVFLHELAHTAAAAIIGLKPSHITLFPFGVNLKLKNNIVYGLSDEIILYISGPLSNLIMSLLCIPLLKYDFFRMFYRCGIALFIFNMLPIMPMDGAVILKKILSRIVGNGKSEVIMKLISILLIIALIIAELLLFMHNGFDYSVLFMIIFLTANIFTNKEKYHMDFLKELMFYKTKNSSEIKKGKIFVVNGNFSLRKIAEKFNQGHYYIVYEQNSDGKIKKIWSECEIIEKLIKGK